MFRVSLLVFLTAFGLRLAFLLQFWRSPLLMNVHGDAMEYLGRAQEILGGDFLGKEIPFFSSVVYPHFLALLLWLSGGSLHFVYLVQIVLGSVNCVLVSVLAQRLAGGSRLAAILAGLFAALYGQLAFFELQLLMITLTLFFLNLCVLFTLRATESDSPMTALVAGLMLGLACLDKPNLLFFVPVALLFIATELRRQRHGGALRSGLLFCAGLAVLLAPAARNYFINGDIVLTASNAGVNLYIGNNPDADGTLYAPPASGLTESTLYSGSVAVAEAALGRKLKPSEVSRFWARRALDFVRDQPARALALAGRKLHLFLNRVEVQEQMDLDFVRREFAPILRLLPVGYWIVAPLALAGFLARGWRRLDGASRLCIGLLAAVALSLLPFFITARLRALGVPVLIAGAAVSVSDLVDHVRGHSWGSVIRWCLWLALIGAFAWPLAIDTSGGQQHMQAGVAYHEQALKTQELNTLKQAVLYYKRGLEIEPGQPLGHFNLGLAYEHLGFFSGSSAEQRSALALDAWMDRARVALRRAESLSSTYGDRVAEADVPQTPFERGRAAEKAGRTAEAISWYRSALVQDPANAQALQRLYVITGEVPRRARR